MLLPLKPIPIKERLTVVFVDKGEIDVVDGAFVVVDQQGFRVRPVLTHIPVGGVVCIMLEPGTRVSHRAAALARVPRARGDKFRWAQAVHCLSGLNPTSSK